MTQTEDKQRVRVELIEAHHVLAAIKELGWVPDEKPPALATIQAQLRRMYLNGGHTNRLSRLREEAIMLAGPGAGGLSEATPAEAAEITPLPENLERRLADWATGVGSFLACLHTDLAGDLGSYRAGADRDAAARIEAGVKSACERIAAADNEMNVALAACNDSADKINELTAALADALSGMAIATGKAEAIADELSAVRSQLATAESALEASRCAAATATGRADAVERELATCATRATALEAGLADLRARVVVLTAAASKADGRADAVEHELDSRTITLVEAEGSLIKAMAASAAATTKVELLSAENSRLREQIKALEGEPTEKATGAEQAAPAVRRGKQCDARGEA